MESAYKQIESILENFDKLQDVLRHPDMQVLEIQDQIDLIRKKLPELSKAYPNVIRWMVVYGMYSRDACKKYLHKTLGDSQKQRGNDVKERFLAFAESQSHYAVYLYKDQCKKMGKRYEAAKAKKIYEEECQGMMKHAKDIQKKEAEAKSEYEEEYKKHHEEKIRELVDFISKTDFDNHDDHNDELFPIDGSLPGGIPEIDTGERDMADVPDLEEEPEFLKRTVSTPVQKPKEPAKEEWIPAAAKKYSKKGKKSDK